MWQYYDYDELGSTNDKAIELTTKATGEKIAVTAEMQTGGRGRRGRRWVGAKGNLFLSLALPFELKNCGALVLISGLALLELIKEVAPQSDVVLKWPNDVLLDDGKISGILLEKGEAGYMIVGIGINVKIAPITDAVYKVNSLANAGLLFDRQEIKDMYLRHFDELLDYWQQQGMPALVKRWLQYAKGIGLPIEVKMPNTTKDGIFAGLNEDGWLILQTEQGQEVISAGDVFFKEEGIKR